MERGGIGCDRSRKYRSLVAAFRQSSPSILLLAICSYSVVTRLGRLYHSRIRASGFERVALFKYFVYVDFWNFTGRKDLFRRREVRKDVYARGEAKESSVKFKVSSCV